MTPNTLVSQQDGTEAQAWLFSLVSVEISLGDALSPTRLVGEQGKAKGTTCGQCLRAIRLAYEFTTWFCFTVYKHLC